MIARYIFFDTTTGLPTFIARPTYVGAYEDGTIYGSNIAKEFPSETETDETILTTYHWDGTYISVHTAKPSDDYYWDVGTFSYLPYSLFTTGNSWNTSTIVANGSATATFGPSVPSGTYVDVVPPAGVNPINQTLITDGIVSFSTQQAGDYLITLSKANYVTYTHTITAT